MRVRLRVRVRVRRRASPRALKEWCRLELKNPIMKWYPKTLMHRLIVPTCSSRSSQVILQARPQGSARRAATKWGTGSAADAQPSHASAMSSRKGSPLSMPG